MTDPRGTRRRRRSRGADDVPRDLREWFAGEPRADTSTPWLALIFPDYVVLPERWRAWKAEHPEGKPPAGWEWLDDPEAPEHPPAWLLAEAHKTMARPRRR